MKKMNVESFNLDHRKVAAPYVRFVGRVKGTADAVSKFDIRFKQPNQGAMAMPALHSLEHLLAEKMRNHLDCVVDVSPMGCQTGFYIQLMNFEDRDKLMEVLEKTCRDILAADEVPAANEVQCGGAAVHDLEGAKEEIRAFLEKRGEWNQVFAE